MPHRRCKPILQLANETDCFETPWVAKPNGAGRMLSRAGFIDNPGHIKYLLNAEDRGGAGPGVLGSSTAPTLGGDS